MGEELQHRVHDHQRDGEGPRQVRPVLAGGGRGGREQVLRQLRGHARPHGRARLLHEARVHAARARSQGVMVFSTQKK